MKNKRNILKWISALSLIFVFLSFSFGNLSFKHQHILSDGTVVEHSHPFSPKNGGQHKHSQDELVFLALMSPQADIQHYFPDFSISTQLLQITTAIVYEEFIQRMDFSINILRGPPIC